MSSFLEDIELASKINEEIKKYEKETKKLAEENIHLSMLNCELEQWLKEHKARIDKAINYINTSIKPLDTKILNNNEIDTLLEILENENI